MDESIKSTEQEEHKEMVTLATITDLVHHTGKFIRTLIHDRKAPRWDLPDDPDAFHTLQPSLVIFQQAVACHLRALRPEIDVHSHAS